MCHAEDGIHWRADLVAHVGQEIGLRFCRRLGYFFRSDKFHLQALEFCDVLGNAIHVGRLSIRLLYDVPQSMNPNDLSVGWTLIGKHDVIRSGPALYRSVKSFLRLLGGLFVAQACVYK